MYEERAEQRRRTLRCGRSVDVREVAAELDEERERDQDARQRDQGVVEDVVREARQAERSGDDAEQDDGALVREPLVDETM